MVSKSLLRIFRCFFTVASVFCDPCELFFACLCTGHVNFNCLNIEEVESSAVQERDYGGMT